MTIRFVAGSPGLKTAAEAAQRHFEEVGLTIKTAEAFRINARERGIIVVRRSDGAFILAFATGSARR